MAWSQSPPQSWHDAQLRIVGLTKRNRTLQAVSAILGLDLYMLNTQEGTSCSSISRSGPDKQSRRPQTNSSIKRLIIKCEISVKHDICFSCSCSSSLLLRLIPHLLCSCPLETLCWTCQCVKCGCFPLANVCRCANLVKATMWPWWHVKVFFDHHRQGFLISPSLASESYSQPGPMSLGLGTHLPPQPYCLFYTSSVSPVPPKLVNCGWLMTVLSTCLLRKHLQSLHVISMIYQTAISVFSLLDFWTHGCLEFPLVAEHQG